MNIKSQRCVDLGKFLGKKSLGEARMILIRSLILDLAQKVNKDTCFRCGQKIIDPEDVELDHKIRWRNASTDKEAQRLFWDTENLALSHSHCNTTDYNRGTNKNGFTGIRKWVYKNTGYTHYTAGTTFGKRLINEGLSKIPEIAAFFRDILVYRLRNGCVVLNFEFLRDYYKENAHRNWKTFTQEELDGIYQKIRQNA